MTNHLNEFFAQFYGPGLALHSASKELLAALSGRSALISADKLASIKSVMTAATKSLDELIEKYKATHGA